MKVTKFFSIYIIIIAMCMVIMPTSALAGEYDFYNAITMGEEINIMIRPSDDSGVIKTLDRGTRIGVLCEESDGWYRMIYGNYRGYMKAKNLLIPDVNTAYGNALSDVGLRAGPSNGSLAVDTIKMGHGVKIVDMIGDWYKVETEPKDGTNSEGYVNKQVIIQTDADDFDMLINKGMAGDSVVDIHKKLYERGFYGYINFYFDENDLDGDADREEVIRINNVFDINTEHSIKCFQYKAGIKITGLADKETLDLLFSDVDIHSIAQDRGINNSVRISRWWESVRYEFGRGATATVYDTRARKTYKVQRYSGKNHADVETLTTEDTAIFTECFGGKRTWDGRAIWVTTGGTTYAASINGYPHAPSNSCISGNSMNGQVCMHFKDSYGHSSSSEDPRHSKMVKSAYLASINYYEMNSALGKQD